MNKLIQQIRERYGYTMCELASLLNVSASTLYRYENGESEPSPCHLLLLKLADDDKGHALLQRIGITD